MVSEALKFNPCVHADAPEWVQRPQTRHLFGPVAQELSALLKESYVEDSDTFRLTVRLSPAAVILAGFTGCGGAVGWHASVCPRVLGH